jgi:Amino acid transporters
MRTNKLKNNSLGIVETAALSVGIMGPSASISIIVIMMTSLAGYSSPFVLFFSMICVGLVSISIIKLNMHFPSSGSVYHFAEVILGKKVGFISGWLIIFTYLALGISCAAVASSYLHFLISGLGINFHWLLIVIALLVLVWFLASRDAKVSIRLLLIFEVISMSVLLALSFIIIKKSASVANLNLAPFTPGNNGLSSIANASLFGFLAFAGFEGASSLGEESKNPKKAIPIAVASAIIISGIFFIIVSYAQVLGFGLTSNGLKALTTSDMPLADLASKYLSGSFSLIIMFCLIISFFATTLACVGAGARILYTMGRDRMLPKYLCKTHNIHNTPYVAINIIISILFLIFVCCFKLNAIDVGQYGATIGILALLISYILATVCAIMFFYRTKTFTGAKFVLLILSLIILVALLFLNTFPIPAYPVNLLVYGLLFYIIVGCLLSFRVG